MIQEIELMRLRDIAFEYLPEVRDYMHQYRSTDHSDYYTRLFSEATSWAGEKGRGSTAIQRYAVQLIQSIASHATYNPDDQEQQVEGIASKEMYDLTVESIANAVKRLSKATGRDIEFNHGVQGESNPPIKTPATTQDWIPIASEIAKGIHEKQPLLSNSQIAEKVREQLKVKGIKGRGGKPVSKTNIERHGLKGVKT